MTIPAATFTLLEEVRAHGPLVVWTPLMHARADLDVTHSMYQEGRASISDLIYQANKVRDLERAPDECATCGVHRSEHPGANNLRDALTVDHGTHLVTNVHGFAEKESK